MEEIQEKLIKYLKDKNIYEETDFTKSNHSDIYFSINKLKELIKVDLKINASKIREFGSNEYILMSDVSNYIKNINDVRQYWIIDIHEIFGLTTIIKSNGLYFIKDSNENNYSGQFMFTYSLWKFLEQNFPKMSISIEDNFIKRLDYDIIINRNKGPRVDIVIDQIKLVIEFDESQHGTFEHVEKDEIRDNIIKAFGYEVIRFKEKSNPIFFFKNLKQIILSQELDENPQLFGENIINYFVKNNIGNREMIKLLVEEQCIDIINQIDFKNIGKTPREINLAGDVFQWLGIQSNNDKKEIKNILEKIDIINYPYIENSNEPYDIILSPSAFEILLAQLDGNVYDNISEFRQLYIKIKNKLLEELYKRIVKMKEKNNNRSTLLKYVSNEGYYRGIKDGSAKYKDLQKKCDYQDTEITILKQIIENNLPKNGRGYIKQNLIKTLDNLKEGEIIIQEIPELVYTGNDDDFIEDIELKIYYEQNKLKYKITRPITECIKDIKNKLKINKDNNSLLDGIIFKCKIIYNKKIDNKHDKKINNIQIDNKDEDDDEM